MLLRQEQEEASNNNKQNEFLYRNFVNAIKSKTTKSDYTRRLKYLIEFLGGSDPDYLVDFAPDNYTSFWQQWFR